jgi:hypothetical protein
MLDVDVTCLVCLPQFMLEKTGETVSPEEFIKIQHLHAPKLLQAHQLKHHTQHPTPSASNTHLR